MVLFTLSQQYLPVLNQSFVRLAQFVSVIIFIIFYLGWSFNLIYKEFWKRDKSALIIHRHYELMRKWVGFIFVIVSLLCFRLLGSLILEETLNMKWSGHSFLIIASLLWIIIYGKILSNPEILYVLPKLEERLSNYTKTGKLNDSVWNLLIPEITNLQESTLKDSINVKIAPYIADIENFVNNAHTLRAPGFSLKDIAEELNIPTSHLAYIFKYYCKISFVEFKKYWRIMDALDLINNDYLNTMTLEAVAEKKQDLIPIIPFMWLLRKKLVYPQKIIW